MNLSLPAKKAIILIAISVVTFICFRYTLHNQFTNWDDDYYVTNDKYIKSFTAHNLKVIFTEDITKNNYHPFCMLSLAVNYFFAGMEPWSYYFTNILIHIANAILVFFLFIQLCRRLKMSEAAGLFIASFGGLWFGIHPMHVESVAWISERKDVLYTLFYLLGLLTYIHYIEEGRKKWYWGTFLLFIASCLSKPMAVVFPMALLCVDILYQRPFTKKLLTEKAIFFLTSLLFGGMAFYTQSRNGAVASMSILTIAERVMYASYGFVMYISKLFNPTYLSTFYPYPYRYKETGALPTIYYVAPFLSLAIAILPAWYFYKKKSPYLRIYLFGMGFFIANIVFVLQFISVGAAIMSDRYSYVAYIGLFFLVAYFLQEAINKFPSIKVPLITLLLILSSGLAVLCYGRTKVWHNSETLLTDAIEKYPYRALLSYKWRGHYYFSIGDFDRALKDYGLLASIRMADKKVQANIERIHALQALGEGGVVLQGGAAAPVDDNTLKLYADSVFAYVRKNDSLGAFRAYIKAYSKSPAIEKTIAENTFNLIQKGDYEPAILQYDMLLKLNTSNAFYYFYRGVAYFGTSRMKTAVKDWEIAVKMNVKDVQQSASYNLSVAYDSLGNDTLAYYYVNKAQALGYNTAPDFVAKLKRKSEAQRAKK